jgi:transcriptional regulator with XRE-family HTH domain
MAATLLASKVKSLSDSLGITQEEVGEITGSSPRTVARWVAGASLPQRHTRDRVLELVYVADQLSKVMKKEAANLWLFTPNPLLGHEKPADRIKRGDFQSVLNLIEALADGVIF